MRTPVGVTLADYIAAVKADAPTHARVTFLGQNIVLEDDDIESTGLQLSSVLNGETDLTMGKAVMSSVTIPILNSNKIKKLIWSGEFQLEVGIEIGGSTKWVTIGYFTGKRPEKIHNVEVISFSANDRMSRFDVLADDWIETLTYPITVNEIYHSLCSYCNVSYTAGDELQTILSRSYSESPFLLEGMMCRDVLANIAEACGCYARINSAGDCQLIWFSDHTDDYTLTGDDIFPPVETFDYTLGKTWQDLEDYKWVELENFRWAELEGTEKEFQIDALKVTSTFYQIDAQIPEIDQPHNIYTIVDNPFLTFQSSAEKTAYLKPIFDRLEAFGGYIPMRLNCLGNALIEAGDIINVVVNGDTIRLPIFCKTMIFNGALNDGYETTGQLNRSEVSPEVLAQLKENAKFQLIVEQIDLVAQNKYDKQSGIYIKPEGIEIDAGEYLKMLSGSELDIESGGNFNVKSNGTLNVESNGSAKIKSGGKLDIESNGDLNVKSGGDINIQSGGKLDIQSGGDISVESSGTMTVKSGGKLSINSGGDLDVKSTNFILDSANKKIDIDTTNFKIDSTNKVVRTGDTKINNKGIQFQTTQALPYSTDYYGTYIGKDRATASEIGLYNSLQLIMSPAVNLDNNKFVGGSYLFNTVYSNNPSDDVGLIIGATSLSGIKDVMIQPYQATGFYIESVTAIRATDVYYTRLNQNSSKDIKHDIQTMPSVGKKIEQLQPVTFVYDDDPTEQTRYGLIYEDTVKVMPEICTNDESNKAINYVELIPMLLKEIQDLRARVKALEEREDN